jgi:hypothetical protein
MRGLSRRGLLAWVALGVLASGCLSPTLPLPPPAPPDVQEIGQGQYRLSGTLPAEGTVIVENIRTNLIYGIANTAAYVIVVEAAPGDDMAIWYVVSEKSSDTTPFQIPQNAPKAPTSDAGARDASVPRDAGRD